MTATADRKAAGAGRGAFTSARRGGLGREPQRTRHGRHNPATEAYRLGVPSEARPPFPRGTTPCHAVKSRIEQELGRALAELGRVWPTLARYVRRGIHVGTLVYQGGHYATASPTFMQEVFSRVDGADKDPGAAERHGEGVARPDECSTSAA
jgi:hypothetical protein